MRDVRLTLLDRSSRMGIVTAVLEERDESTLVWIHAPRRVS
jgi:hypothetical protein